IFLFAILQLNHGACVDGISGNEIPRRQLLEMADGLADFRRLPGLPAREVRSFQSTRVIFVFSFTLLVSRLRTRRFRRLLVESQITPQLINDTQNQFPLVHAASTMQSEFLLVKRDAGTLTIAGVTSDSSCVSSEELERIPILLDPINGSPLAPRAQW